MKAIMISIKPEWVAKILNGEKTLEIRKTMPKCDLPIDVYIYCTKNGGKPYDSLVWDNDGEGLVNSKYFPYAKDCPENHRILNGKVVAKFTLNKVEKIHSYLEPEQWYKTNDTSGSDLMKKSCLSFKELDGYLLSGWGYAWHIDNLVIFDKPKEISEFYGAFTHKRYEHIFGNNIVELDEEYGGLRQPIKGGYEYTYPLTRAPQSWCWIEVDNE